MLHIDASHGRRNKSALFTTWRKCGSLRLVTFGVKVVNYMLLSLYVAVFYFADSPAALPETVSGIASFSVAWFHFAHRAIQFFFLLAPQGIGEYGWLGVQTVL